ncbi:MAG TPA: hypothetical protein VIN03_27040 [Roseateles sp.]
MNEHPDGQLADIDQWIACSVLHSLKTRAPGTLDSAQAAATTPKS